MGYWKMFSTSDDIASAIRSKEKKLGPFWSDTYFGKLKYKSHHNNSVVSTQIILNKHINSEAAHFLSKKIFDLIMGVSNFPKFDYVIPVPNLLNENNDVVNSKAVSIAFDLSDLLNMHCSVDVLIKTQDRVKNQGIGERRASVNRSYFINNNLPIKDKRIILVDDVLTTGATTERCADLLLEYGANQVIIICVGKNYYV
jgi:competence protein ComFC